MMTIDQLQEPQSLRLAMGELNANELRIAQAAVRFAHFHLSRVAAQAPAPKIAGWNDGNYLDEQYVKGWNDCREAILATYGLFAQ
jgi:hypothetical protein